MRNYRLMTSLVAPLIPLWLRWRQKQGKEDAHRLRERFGHASKPRADGQLVWLHAASVGEANSVLILIQKIIARYPDLHCLLTTGTVTSAHLMQKRLPAGVIHQYAPVDTPAAVKRFISHWKPDIAFWVESEFWPNLMMETNEAQAFMGLINGRMSERSFIGWQKKPGMIKPMLSCFDIAFAQTDADAKRLKQLGAKDVQCLGNLKYDAAFLPANEDELITLQSAIGSRPVWLAASTHPGEEEMIAKVHNLLVPNLPGLLTIIVPRHPARGVDITASMLKNISVSLRSRDTAIAADTQIYIADTLGELGLFYRLCEVVFMGGSLVAHGGQNPLEPARFSCAILAGPHTQNFAEIYADMENSGICLRVMNTGALAAQVEHLLKNTSDRDQMQRGVKKWMAGKGGAADRLMQTLEPVFDPKNSGSAP